MNTNTKDKAMTRQNLSEDERRHVERVRTFLDQPHIADNSSRRLLEIIDRLTTSHSASIEAEEYIQSEIDRAPAVVQRLGAFLADVLDEDHWKNAESMLLRIAALNASPPAPQAEGELERVADAIDAARYARPEFPRERPHPFSQADHRDREYAFRLARAALRSAQAPTLTEHAIQRIILDNLKIELGKVGDHITSAHINQDSLDTVCGLLVKAPTRTYADGIEDAAKVADGHVQLLIGHANCDPSGDAMSMAESIRDAIRALATKPAHVSGKEDDNA